MEEGGEEALATMQDLGPEISLGKILSMPPSGQPSPSNSNERVLSTFPVQNTDSP